MELNNLIRNCFLQSLEAARSIEPGTPEWDLIWNNLQIYKKYAEGKYMEENNG